MANKTDILNMALVNLGQDVIATVEEISKEANTLRIHYDNALKDVLRDYDWGFAKRQITAAELPEAPLLFAHAYAYPTDCAKARRVMRGFQTGGVAKVAARQSIIFEVGRSSDGKQKAILTNCPPPAILEYTTANIQPSELDPKFVTAFSWRLSAAIAFGILNDPSAAQNALQFYSAALSDAKGSDADEGRLPRLPDGAFLQSRRW